MVWFLLLYSFKRIKLTILFWLLPIMGSYNNVYICRKISYLVNIQKLFSYLLTWLLLFSNLAVFSQQVKVIDFKSGEALPYVTIMNPSGSNTSHTNVKGMARVSSFENDSMIFRMVGYNDTLIPYSSIETDLMIVKLHQDNVALNEFVVSAHRWEQDKEDIAAKIENIDAREIDFKNPQTAADLVGETGYVYVQKSQLGGGSPMIRGFATNRILLVADGVRMNNAIFRSGNLQNIISLDAQSVKNAEVLFGPSSVIYGSDAIGGVLDFHTIDPEVSTSGNTEVNGNTMLRSASANGEKSIHFDLNAGGEKWASLSSFSFSDYDDQKMGSHGPDDYLRNNIQKRINGRDSILSNDDPELQVPTGFHQFSGIQKVLYKASENLELQYGLYYSRTSDIPRYDRLIQGNDEDGLQYAQWYYGPQSWMMNHLKVTHKAENNKAYNKVRFTAAFQDYEESRHDRRFRSSKLRHRNENVKAYSLNADFEKEAGQKTSFFYGGEGVLNRVFSNAEEENINTGVTSAAPSRYPSGASWESYSVYALLRHKYKNWLTLNAGARYNHFIINAPFDTTFYNFPFTEAKINNGAPTGSFGFTVHPGNKWRAYANVSTGFRAPNIDDVGKVFDSEPGAVVVPNPDLKAEYAYNAEAGFVLQLLKQIKFDGAVYYTLLENAMSRRPYSFSGKDSIIYDGRLSEVQALQNVSSAEIWGVQGGVFVQLTNNFSLKSDFSYQTGKVNDDSFEEEYPVRHVAPWFGSSAMTYRFRMVKLQAYIRYNGAFEYEDLSLSERNKPHLYAKDENGKLYVPSWYTLNFRASFQLEEGVKLTAGVENITDIRYRPYSSGIAAPGRNFTVAMHVNF